MNAEMTRNTTPTDAQRQVALFRARFEDAHNAYERAQARLVDEASTLGLLYAASSTAMGLENQTELVVALRTVAEDARERATVALRAYRAAEEAAGL